MQKRRLLYTIFPSYLLITLVSLLAVSWYALSFTRQFYLERTQLDLESSGRLLERQVLRSMSPLDAAAVNAICKDAGAGTVVRVTVILPDGRVIGDSDENPAHMENHRNRAEIRAAYQGRVGMSVRHSDTLEQMLMYVALPLSIDGKVVGVLRTAIPFTAIDDRVGAIRIRIAIGSLLVALLASAMSWYVSKRITTRLEKMRDGAQRFADGALDHRLPMSKTLEFSELADAMNQMAKQLQQRIDEIDDQRSKTEAVLYSMREGVIALNMDKKVISINQAAAGMFGVSMGAAKGRNVIEVMRNLEFEELINKRLSAGDSLESDVVYQNADGERTLNVNCAPLLDSQKERIGSLAVISDVTQLRRLENMRRDFAASVSHEIKTPLTAIKGFVETLRTVDTEDKEEITRFLSIIDKHVNRLAAILDDLMQLSRIERADEVQQIGLERVQIADVLNTAVGLCSERSQEKQIDVQIVCDEDLSGCFDATLLEQAAVNLLDNAIKYSPEKSTVTIEAEAVNDEIEIRFKDLGIGIAKKHLPRLFERFYRVDKARSRKMGGTGLGLAIVKHIAQAHGGDVTVDSELEKGSTFTLRLPTRKRMI
jgi:two-component system phosphate regulon sensor histidine kinase PhoR